MLRVRVPTKMNAILTRDAKGKKGRIAKLILVYPNSSRNTMQRRKESASALIQPRLTYQLRPDE